MVEYAIGLSVLLLLTICVVDLSRAIWVYNTVAYLAREGARHGIVPSRNCADIKSYVVSRAVLEAPDGQTSFDQTNVRLGPPPPASESRPAPGGQVIVTVTFGFTPILATLWGGGPITIQATSQMYVEQGLSVGTC